MSTRHLILYPNCSMGGVTSVIRGRARRYPDDVFEVIFFQDRGGRDAFNDLPNVEIRVSRRDRAKPFVAYTLSTRQYATVHFLSCPEIAVHTADIENGERIYEFHSSDMKVIRGELELLSETAVHKIIAPSTYMVNRIRIALPGDWQLPVEREPNLVDTGIFHRKDERATPALASPRRPLIWVGRFDKGKAYRSFLRLLKILPQETFHGIMITSLESDPQRAAECLGEAGEDGVSRQVDLLANLPQSEIARIYRFARDSGGALISTSLLESFGYTVTEAAACGLPVIGFDLPALREHDDPEGLITLVDIGNVGALAAAVQSLDIPSGRIHARQ